MSSVNIGTRTVYKFKDNSLSPFEDQLALEEPLEILLFGRQNGEPFKKPISITMRTPGQDIELAAGFLFTEGLLTDHKDLDYIRQSGENTVSVKLRDELKIDLTKLERHFYTNSSCGVCGKGSLENLRSLEPGRQIQSGFSIDYRELFSLNEKVRQVQNVFQSTGGLHASALFDSKAELMDIYEDVGRHNALDKVVGHYFLQGQLPLSHALLFLSGRASFELLQKAAMAGIPVVTALGAPSSLAVETAEEFGITLIGFLKDKTFNLYTHPERIANLNIKP